MIKTEHKEFDYNVQYSIVMSSNLVDTVSDI